MEIRAAWIVRERTSRPYSSVPNQGAAFGGRSLSAMLTSYGEYGAIWLAKGADATTATTRTAPMTRTRWRLQANATNVTAPNPRPVRGMLSSPHSSTPHYDQ